MSSIEPTTTVSESASMAQRAASVGRTLLVVVTLCAPMATRAQNPADPRVDRLFAEWDRAGSPGCALGVAQNGRLTYSRGYGSAILDYDVPLTPRSVFYLGSVSKQFTAAAVVLAARQGRLSLDDDIRRHLPELRDYGAPITIRHLLHHTSGLRDYLTLLPLAGSRLEDVLTNDALIDLIARQRSLNFPPGSEFLYSNTGYVLLAEIVARATGKSLRAFADEQIFRPLGMRDTHFHDDARVVVRNRVIGYSPDSSGFRINHLFNFDKVGDGGLYSTVEDLARWDQNFYDAKIGGSGFVAQLLERGVLSKGDSIPYALGLTHGVYRGLRTVEHGGSLAGFRTNILRFPEQRFSAIVLCNLTTANPAGLSRKIAEIYLADRMQGIATVAGRGGPPPNAAGASPDGAVPGPLGADALREYAGVYASEELGATYTLVVEGDRLVARRANGTRMMLRAIRRDAFLSPPATTVAFTRDGDGRLTGFALDAGRVRNLVFERRR